MLVHWATESLDVYSKSLRAVLHIAHMPKCIYIKFDKAELQIADLERGVYPLKPKSLMWTALASVKT